MTGLAGMAAGTMLLCPARPRRHVMADVYRTADGVLFIRSFVLSGSTPGYVQCLACGRSYLVDPTAVRNAVSEGLRRYAVPR